MQIEITLSNNTVIPPITLSVSDLNNKTPIPIGDNLTMKVSGDTYFGATTAIILKSIGKTTSVPLISQLRFIDASTNGLIASKPVT